MAPTASHVLLLCAALLPTAASVRFRGRRAAASTGALRLALERQATTFESEVGTMDAVIFGVGARLAQASELLGAAVNATAVAKGQAPAAGKAPAAHANTTEVAKGQAPAAGKAPAAHHLKKNVTKALLDEKHVLEGLFNHLKLNIKEFNSKEKSNKAENEVTLKRLQERLKHDKEMLKNPSKLSAFQHEELVNRTRLEEHEVQYWSHGRQLQHGMFHSNLKLTHGLMQRVKTVMEAYTQALSHGKVDPKLFKQMTAAALPKVFAQMRAELRRAAKQRRGHLLTEAQILSEE